MLFYGYAAERGDQYSPQHHRPVTYTIDQYTLLEQFPSRSHQCYMGEAVNLTV